MLDSLKTRHQRCHLETQDATVFYREAGKSADWGVLLHGMPSSSHSFRDVMSPLAEVARVVAPDLPGYGFTEVPDDYDYTFASTGELIDAFIRAVGLERFYLYVHDYGAPVAYHLALAEPERVLGLIIQNGNAHHEGMGEAWDTAKAYWADPTPENRAALPDWPNF